MVLHSDTDKNLKKIIISNIMIFVGLFISKKFEFSVENDFIGRQRFGWKIIIFMAFGDFGLN